MAQPTILVVDDEPFNVDYLEQELEELSYNIITASNGKDALDQVRIQRPDLILLDIMMPVMDGFATLEELKADPLPRHIPVIVISAVNDLQSVVKGIQFTTLSEKKTRQRLLNCSIIIMRPYSSPSPAMAVLSTRSLVMA